MRVICIFPITNNDRRLTEILKAFQTVIAPGLVKLGADPAEIKFVGNDYIYVEKDGALSGLPKGKAVVGALGALKNVSEKPRIVICCDGSGKIPYRYIVDIFRELTADSSTHCVMANRINNKAISPTRYIIERFEIYALIRLFEYPGQVPDGQCGLWAFRNGPLDCNGSQKEISLSAEGYELELDLLGEVLDKKLKHSFVDVELPTVSASTYFTAADNIKKMRFLFTKYAKLKAKVSVIMNDFEKGGEFVTLASADTEIDWEAWDDYKAQLENLCEEFSKLR